MTNCNMLDMPICGYYTFTWFRRRGHHDAVEERLNKALVTTSWLSIYPNAQLVNELAPISDHHNFFKSI